MKTEQINKHLNPELILGDILPTEFFAWKEDGQKQLKIRLWNGYMYMDTGDNFKLGDSNCPFDKNAPVVRCRIVDTTDDGVLRWEEVKVL